MKKEYQKPTMRVVELQRQAHLLAGSNYDDELNYAPGITPADEKNKLA